MSSGDPVKVLIVDDIEVNRELLISYLEDVEGLELFEAENGLEALEITRDKHPLLVFLDMKMPVMDGITYAEKVRSELGSDDIRIVAVTASAMKEQVEQWLKWCDGCLTKPVSLSDILGELKIIGVDA